MQRPVSGGGTGGLPLSQDEQQYYDKLFDKVDVERKGSIRGDAVKSLFPLSGLEKHVLAEIWSLADRNKAKALSKQDFFIALRLIAAAQSGMPVNYQSLELPVGYPKFEGINLPPGVPLSGARPVHTPAVAASAGVGAPGASPYVYGMPPGAAGMPGASAGAGPAAATGTPQPAAAGQYPVYGYPPGYPQQGMMPGQQPPMQQQQQPLTYPPGVAMPPGAAAAVQGYRVVPGPGGVPVSQPLNMQPQAAGLAAPASLNPMEQARGSAVSPVPGASPGPDAVWEIDEMAFQTYMTVFSQADKDHDGFVSAHEAKGFFAQSKLSRPHLQQIWSLADHDKDNKLSPPEFAVAFHLVMVLRRQDGTKLPAALPEPLMRVIVARGPAKPGTVPAAAMAAATAAAAAVTSPAGSAAAAAARGTMSPRQPANPLTAPLPELSPDRDAAGMLDLMPSASKRASVTSVTSAASGSNSNSKAQAAPTKSSSVDLLSFDMGGFGTSPRSEGTGSNSGGAGIGDLPGSSPRPTNTAAPAAAGGGKQITVEAAPKSTVAPSKQVDLLSVSAAGTGAGAGARRPSAAATALPTAHAAGGFDDDAFSGMGFDDAGSPGAAPATAPAPVVKDARTAGGAKDKDRVAPSMSWGDDLLLAGPGAGASTGTSNATGGGGGQALISSSSTVSDMGRVAQEAKSQASLAVDVGMSVMALETASEHVQSLKEQAGTLHKQQQDLASKIEQNKAQLAKLSEQAAEQEAMVAAERQKKADLELKLKEAQDQTRALELMMQQKTKDIEDIKQSQTETERMIADERKRARDRELDVALLEQELTQLRASLKQVEDLKPNQKSIVDARSAQLARLRRDKADLMDMLNAARNELEAITNQGSLLKDAIAEQTSSQKVLREQLSDVQSILETEKSRPVSAGGGAKTAARVVPPPPAPARSGSRRNLNILASSPSPASAGSSAVSPSGLAAQQSSTSAALAGSAASSSQSSKDPQHKPVSHGHPLPTPPVPAVSAAAAPGDQGEPEMDEFPEFNPEIEAVVEQMDDDGPGSASAPAAAPHAEPGTPLDRATPARPVAAADGKDDPFGDMPTSAPFESDDWATDVAPVAKPAVTSSVKSGAAAAAAGAGGAGAGDDEFPEMEVDPFSAGDTAEAAWNDFEEPAPADASIAAHTSTVAASAGDEHSFDPPSAAPAAASASLTVSAPAPAFPTSTSKPMLSRTATLDSNPFDTQDGMFGDAPSDDPFDAASKPAAVGGSSAAVAGTSPSPDGNTSVDDEWAEFDAGGFP